jgi:hypothetical protein
MRRIVLALLLLSRALLLLGQQKDAASSSPIQDNSFLIEEAYNQEPGVVQHINSFLRTHPGGAWLYTFTQEWPVPEVTHQLSYSLAYVRLAPDSGDARGPGDFALNYRYQLVGNGETRIAVAPRVTLILPTGDERKGLGSGTVGYQVNFPLSTVLSDRLVAHWNAGATWTPRARNTLGQRADTTAVNFGQSTIFHVLSTLDLMLEIFWSRTQSVAAPGRTEADRTFLLSPGVRFAWNAPHGLQIVPGIGIPLGVGPSRSQRSVLLYLSFEHPFREIHKGS